MYDLLAPTCDTRFMGRRDTNGALFGGMRDRCYDNEATIQKLSKSPMFVHKVQGTFFNIREERPGRSAENKQHPLRGGWQESQGN